MGGGLGSTERRHGGRTVTGEASEPVPPSGAVPRPAATVVLVREGASPLEVLLLRRNRSTGFVPGAYVFPGGRVDARDGDPDLVGRVEGLGTEEAAARLALRGADPPAIAYYLAAAREAFEETAILVAATTAQLQRDADRLRLRSLRDELMAGDIDFGEVLDGLGARLDGTAIEYIAHWITPEAEPRRYDTRFFAAIVPPKSEPSPDPREMTDAVWLAPAEALARHEAGRLPMIFPTIRTLEGLSTFDTPDAVLSHYRTLPIPSIMPTLMRTPEGLRINIIEEDGLEAAP